MVRSPLTGQMLKISGILLSIMAVIHFPPTPLGLHPVSRQSTTEEFRQLEPPFLLSFIAVGMLLLSAGLSSVFGSIRRGQGLHGRSVLFGEPTNQTQEVTS